LTVIAMTLPLELIIETLTFFMAVAVIFAISDELERVFEQRRRLGELRATAASAPLLQKRVSTNSFLMWVQKSSSISDSEARQKLRVELFLAGFDHPSAPIWFVIIRFAIAIGLPFAFLFGRWAFGVSASSIGIIFWTMVLCCVGLLAPRSFLDRRVASRRTRMEFEFPDALDLMVVCIESGLSLEAAFVRVGQEVRRSHPRIAEEFARVSDELRAGRSRTDALRALGERTGVGGVKSFAALAIQTEVLGTSIAQTLRTYSVEMRETRFLRAEEKALRIPVLMTIPLVACILPVIVTALLLPAIIDVIRVLLPALVGHGVH
jgi:tight adherence protein C